jgi:two-component system, chemotaxis family, sensor kinase CheA
VSEIVKQINEFVERNNNILRIKDFHERQILVPLERIKALAGMSESLGQKQLVTDIEKLLERQPEEYFTFLSYTYISTAEKLCKKAAPIVWAPSVSINPYLYSDLFKSLIHIVRNAADHGLEMPLEREKINKNRSGLMKGQLTLKDGFYYLTLEDDGRGVNAQEVRQEALQWGIEVPTEPSDLLGLIFLPHFSTKRQANGISGLGVGLSAVKEEAEKLQGSVTVASVPGQGTIFTIKFKKIDCAQWAQAA